MKLTHEKLAALKALKMPDWLARKDDPWAHEAARAIPALIADLEEARCRIHDLETICDPAGLTIENAQSKDQLAALQIMYRKAADELAATRKQLVAAQTLLGKAQAHKFFCLTELRRVQDVMLSEAGLGIVDARIYELTESAALDAAIAEAIEPYRKDTERLDLLGKLCKETLLRPNAFCSEIAPDTRLRYDFPTLVSYDSVGNQISLRDAIDAAIAAKGETNEQTT